MGSSFYGINAGNLNSEVIILNSLSLPLSVLPGSSFLGEEVITGIQLTYNLTGGSFSISILQGVLAGFPVENAIISLPFGRVGVVKSTGKGFSSGGLVDTISGQIVPLQAALQDAFTSQPGVSITLAAAANSLLGGANWETANYLIRNFSFRGLVLSGIQQLASYLLADVIVRSSIHVVDPGSFPADSNPFSIPKSDIVSASQVIDYSNDLASILDPSLSSANFVDEGDFIYDSEHAQKQPKFTVQAGAPGSQGSTDHIDIPDGWLVDGDFEEWTPADPLDLTNPSATPTNGRYWKVVRSPTSPGMLRGITTFTRLVKQINIPKNVSTFIGSPISGLTNVGGFSSFQFDNPGVESGIVGFNAIDTQLFDVISSQFLDIANAIVLIPGSSIDTGYAASNFYSITMELWTFPRVSPTVFPTGNPANPFNIPRGVATVTPNSNVVNGLTSGYYAKYLSNYKLINSPRLRTTLSCVFRNTLPQPGDSLFVNGLDQPSCGRIQSVSLNFGRSGMVLSIVAEKYQAAPGLWQSSTGGETLE